MDGAAAGEDLRGGVHRRDLCPRSATGRVGNRPIYAAIGVDLDGHKDILGLWAGVGGGESARCWLQVLSELKNRGVQDIFFVVCDGPVGAAGLGRVGLPGSDRADLHHRP